MNYSTRHITLPCLLLAVPISAWTFAYRPMNFAVRSAAEEIKDRTSKLTNYDEVNKQYRDMKMISQSLAQANKMLMDRIPKSHNADQWLESASDAAMQLGLVVQSVTTSGEYEVGECKVMPVDLKISGNFESVYKLVQHLEQMDRVTNIYQMNISHENETSVYARFVIHLVFGDEAGQ